MRIVVSKGDLQMETKKTIKVMVFKPGKKAEIVDFPVIHDYTDIKKVLEISSPIDCASRTIGGKLFDIWCDDEGLLKDNLKTCAFNDLTKRPLNEVICGNIMIATSCDGEITGLSDADIALIQSHTILIDKPNLGFSCNFGDISVEINSQVLLYD